MMPQEPCNLNLRLNLIVGAIQCWFDSSPRLSKQSGGVAQLAEALLRQINLRLSRQSRNIGHREASWNDPKTLQCWFDSGPPLFGDW